MESPSFKAFLKGKNNKKSMWMPVSTRSDGTTMGIPVMVVNGIKPNPVLLVEACCHGDESEGALAVVKLMKELDPKKLKGTVVGVPAVNVPAYEASTRGNPEERYNYDMNRLFPGNPNGSVSEKIVHTYFSEIVSNVDYVVSLHGGGNLFCLVERLMVSDDPKSVNLAKAMGKRWKFLHSSRHEGTLLTACKVKGIPAFIAELGGSNNRLPNALMQNVQSFLDGIGNVMKHLGMQDGTPEYAERLWYLEATNVRCRYGGIIIPEKRCNLNEEVKKGDKLLTIVNLFGEELERVNAPQEGMILGVPASPIAYPGNNILTIAKPSKPVL